MTASHADEAKRPRLGRRRGKLSVKRILSVVVLAILVVGVCLTAKTFLFLNEPCYLVETDTAFYYDGDIMHETSYRYNDIGANVETSFEGETYTHECSEDQGIAMGEHRVKWRENLFGDVTLIEYFDGDDLFRTVAYEYYGPGRIRKETNTYHQDGEYWDAGETSWCWFNRDGWIERSDGTDGERCVYSYERDNRGRIIKQIKTYSGASEEVWVSTYVYNDDDQIVTEFVDIGNEGDGVKSAYTYVEVDDPSKYIFATSRLHY